MEEKAPLIPTRDNVNAIINNSGKKYATIFTLLSEIGCAPHELENVTQNDIDIEQGIISIRGVKGHASGNYKLNNDPPKCSESTYTNIQKNTLFHHPKRCQTSGETHD